MDVNVLESKLKSKYPRIWRCADSYRWEDFENSNLLTFNYLEKVIDYRESDWKEKEKLYHEGGNNSISAWINNLKKGDLIFVMSKNDFNGICIAESEYCFNGPFQLVNGIEKPAISVKYIFRLKNPAKHDLKTHGNPATFASIDSYNFGLTKILNYIKNKQPKAYSLLKKETKTKIIIKNSFEMTTKTKNIILYGPPGTGKTYHSIDKAVEIAFEKQNSHEKSKEIFDKLREEGQIEFITFHQNYSYENFMVGLRPDIERDQLMFKENKGIFYQICKRARDNYVASITGKNIEHDYESVFEEIMMPLEKGEKKEIKMKSGISYWIYGISDHSIQFEKSAGGTAHTLSKDTLKNLVEGTRKNMPSGLAPYYLPLVNLIRNEMQALSSKSKIKEELRKFVIIIDEINRANISKVFGELITLLEEDKRLGAKNELSVTLTNEETFTIPPNLYIIGTMNTADKSIALVDIALRRRFEFLGYYPNYDLIDGERKNLLKFINKKIFEKKKSPDYLIGHAYFMKTINENISTEEILEKKIIPLLLEYFSNKIEMIKEIFNGSEWNINYNEETYSWSINKINS